MVQVHVLAREWGFDSPLGHHLSFMDETLDETAEDGPELPPPPTFGKLLASNVKIVAGVALLALMAYGTWRGIAALFPDVPWLQPKP
jgi:hypothetical protein